MSYGANDVNTRSRDWEGAAEEYQVQAIVKANAGKDSHRTIGEVPEPRPNLSTCQSVLQKLGNG